MGMMGGGGKGSSGGWPNTGSPGMPMGKGGRFVPQGAMAASGTPTGGLPPGLDANGDLPGTSTLYNPTPGAPTSAMPAPGSPANSGVMARLLSGGAGGGQFGAAEQSANQNAQAIANTPAAVQAASRQFQSLSPQQQAQWLQVNPQMKVAMVNAGLLSNDQINTLLGGATANAFGPNTMQPFQYNGPLATPQRSSSPGSGNMGGTGAGAAETAHDDTNAATEAQYGKNPNTNYGSFLRYDSNGNVVEGINQGGMLTPGDTTGATVAKPAPFYANTVGGGPPPTSGSGTGTGNDTVTGHNPTTPGTPTTPSNTDQNANNAGSGTSVRPLNRRTPPFGTPGGFGPPPPASGGGGGRSKGRGTNVF